MMYHIVVRLVNQLLGTAGEKTRRCGPHCGGLRDQNKALPPPRQWWWWWLKQSRRISLNQNNALPPSSLLLTGCNSRKSEFIPVAESEWCICFGYISSLPSRYHPQRDFFLFSLFQMLSIGPAAGSNTWRCRLSQNKAPAAFLTFEMTKLETRQAISI